MSSGFAAGIPMPSFRISLSLTPVTACSFSGLFHVEKLCERFGVSQNQLYQWISLWRIHKPEWLGVLADIEVSDWLFLKDLLSYNRYSSFSMGYAIQCNNSSATCRLENRTIPSAYLFPGYLCILTTQPWDGCGIPPVL